MGRCQGGQLGKRSSRVPQDVLQKCLQLLSVGSWLKKAALLVVGLLSASCHSDEVWLSWDKLLC